MLVEIHSDSFAPQNAHIQFGEGLNTILGSSNGSNAIGKTTALWLIDYAFGGDKYNTLWKDSADHIGRSPVYFTFRFEEEDYHFFRTLEEPKIVVRCDANGNVIDKKSLDWYHNWLSERYGLKGMNTISAIQARFFRIYGADNIFEHMPFIARARETDEQSIEYLLRLSGNGAVIDAIDELAERLQLPAAQLLGKPEKPVDTKRIEENLRTIEALRKRLDETLEDADQSQLVFLGFTAEEFDRLQELQKQVRLLVKRRNQAVSRRDAIASVRPHVSVNIEEEFDALLEFFPGIELKPYEQIEQFHRRLREILKDESRQEVNRLDEVIAQYDVEIRQLQERVQKSGVPRELSAGKVSQCASITLKIRELENENDALKRQEEQQASRAAAREALRELIEQREQSIGLMIAQINAALVALNRQVTNDAEAAPILSITPKRELNFGTLGNISEGTAFKSLVLYDLALASSYDVPVLIHDSNILKRIEDTQLEHILQCYQRLGKQVFIAYDKAETATQTARSLLESTARLRLSDENVLFGKAWNRNR